jgi:hypothetical protein
MSCRCPPVFPIEQPDGIHRHFAFPSLPLLSSGPSFSETFFSQYSFRGSFCPTSLLLGPAHFYLLTRLYPLFNKNQAAWNFPSPELEVTWGTVAIIIRVVLPYPIPVHSWRFSVFHSLQSITPCIY